MALKLTYLQVRTLRYVRATGTKTTSRWICRLADRSIDIERQIHSPKPCGREKGGPRCVITAAPIKR